MNPLTKCFIEKLCSTNMVLTLHYNITITMFLLAVHIFKHISFDSTAGLNNSLRSYFKFGSWGNKKRKMVRKKKYYVLKSGDLAGQSICPLSIYLKKHCLIIARPVEQIEDEHNLVENDLWPHQIRHFLNLATLFSIVSTQKNVSSFS